MKKFILMVEMFALDGWSPQHAMLAKDEADALNIAKNWALYHGMGVHSVRVQEPIGTQGQWEPEAFFDRFRK